MNLDLFADLEPEVAARAAAKPVAAAVQQNTSSQMAAYTQGFSAAAREWGRSTIEDLAAASDAKTRLKNLKADKGAYEALVDACVFVAWRKREAYRLTFEGKSVAQLDGWIVQNPELAHAIERFTRCFLAVDELAMLPAHLSPVTH